MFVHFSTDYVFDGRTRSPYREDDATAPLGVYGRTKLAGEEAVRAAGGRHLILRTSWVFAARGRNFLQTMLRLAEAGGPLRVVDDQVGSPTLADDLADATAAILARHRGSRFADLPAGVYHASGAGETTWCRFARRIVAAAGYRDVEVQAITSAEFPTPAPRPRYSVLCNERLWLTFGIRLPSWEDAVDRCLQSIGQR
jgi:dTDP-4-dehydrorhamnose reductase